jgi:uridylate kinase
MRLKNIGIMFILDKKIDTMISQNNTYVIKLGGSLVYTDSGLNTNYIKKLYHFIRNQVEKKQRRFIIVVGGGKLSRHYRDAGAEITEHKLPKDDLDWLGIHATRLNAHLFRTIFRDLAHPTIIRDYDSIQKTDKPIIIAAGWKPGWSADYDAVILARDYHVPTVIKMSDVDCVYDKDPRLYPDARPYKNISWDEYRRIIGDEWVPGKSTPFDPVASKLAFESGVSVVYLNGANLDNLEKLLEGQEFVGTVIK